MAPDASAKRKRPSAPSKPGGPSTAPAAPKKKRQAHASRSRGARTLKRQSEDEEIAALDRRCKELASEEKQLARFEELPLSARTLKGE